MADIMSGLFVNLEMSGTSGTLHCGILHGVYF